MDILHITLVIHSNIILTNDTQKNAKSGKVDGMTKKATHIGKNIKGTVINLKNNIYLNEEKH